MLSYIFGGSNITVALYPTEFKILAAGGFTAGEFKGDLFKIDPKKLDQKAKTLLDTVQKQCSESNLNKFLFKIGFGEVSRNWRLAEDLKIVANDLKERYRDPIGQAVRYAASSALTVFLNCFSKVRGVSPNYYKGRY